MSHTVNAMSKRTIQRFANKGVPVTYVLDASGEEIVGLTAYTITLDAGTGAGSSDIRDAVYG